MENYYTALGVSRTASIEEIRDAYRRHAMRHHPDHNPDTIDASRFREVQEAYEVLGDPGRKRAYDKELESTEGRAKVDEGRHRFAWSSAPPLRTGYGSRPPVWPKEAPIDRSTDEPFSASDESMPGNLRRLLARLEEFLFADEEGSDRPAGPVRW